MFTLLLEKSIKDSVRLYRLNDFRAENDEKLK